MRLLKYSILLLLLAAKASGNIGAFSYTKPALSGNLGLNEDIDFSQGSTRKMPRLIEENLSIQVSEDLHTFDVEAHYRLQPHTDNPPLRLFLPIHGGIPSSGDEERTLVQTALMEVDICESTELLVGDKKIELVRVKGSDFKAPILTYEKRAISFNYCVSRDVVRLDLPQTEVKLKYKSEMIREIDDHSVVGKVVNGTIDLYYPLHVASPWAGKIAKFNAKIIFKYGAGLARPHHKSDWSRKGNQWILTKKDFSFNSDLPFINFSLSPHAYRIADNLSRGDKREKLSPNALNQKSLPKNGSINYDHTQLFDGDFKTAFCEGEAGNGVGLEINLGESSRFIVLNAGYAKSDETFKENNSIEEIQLLDCKSKQPFKYNGEISKGTVEKFGDGKDTFFFLEIPYGAKASRPRSCVLAKVTKVRKGRVNDLCISELFLSY